MQRSRVLRALVLLSLMLGMLGPAQPRLAQAQDASAQATTIIAALSDYGSGEIVEQTIATLIAGWNPAAIVTAGDNYHYQNCTSYETCVGTYYGSFVSAQTFYPTLGNHDYDATVGLTAYNNYFTYLPTNVDAQRRWYDVVIGDVHFFMLDGNGNQSTQSTWLSTAVPASTSVWNIAIIHQAPYSTGRYGDIAASQMPYGAYGIDFVISGHNHHFQRLLKADGGADVRYFIDGYGGSLPSGLGHSYCNYSTSAATSEFCLAETPGALKITASDTSITFEYYSSAGALQSTYTQDAEEPGPAITVAGTLQPFHTTPGTPSAYQSYTVSGVNLTSGIDISAPGGFELATASGGPYGWLVTLPQVGGTVAGTPIYVRLTGADEGTFGGNIAHASSGATTQNVPVSGTVEGANEPPDVPVPVGPANGGTGVSMPPTLEVTVSDPNADEMCVTFWGRETGASGGEDFTLFVYPDTQSHAASVAGAATFITMSNYIANNKTALNVAFVTCVGDVINTSNSDTQWQRADAAYDILDAAEIPYSVGPGNHDIAFGTTYWANYFGHARFTGKSWYGGYYTAGGDNYNSYSLFSAGGMDFILINLQYQVGSGALDWADALLKTYSDRRAIVEQHDILNLNNSWNNQAAYTALSDNPNLFLMLCGHMHNTSDGSAYLIQNRTGMNPVHILLTDYQDFNTLPNSGFLRILTFRPADDEIYAEVYSPPGNVHLTNASNYEQFTMAYDMQGAAPFQQLGQVCGIASGAKASLSWTGLGGNTEYEWYAVAADGSESTTGPTWSFTTGAATGTLGDVNGDSLVNSTDALIVLSADAAMDTSQFCPLNCGDVNSDGWVNSTDALIILSYDAGMSVPFPIGTAGCPSSITQPPGCGS